MKYIINIILSLVLLINLSSCKEDKTTRNVEYMASTDMYKSVPYQTYGESPNFKNGMSSQLPVKGTIARGNVPYDYPDTNEGYELAKSKSKSPIEVNEENTKKGEYLFGIYCVSCHGPKGDGQGVLVQREKFLGVPNYKDRQITEGSIYHVIMYGRNMMGSHASQLKYNERWQIVQYVQKLKKSLDSIK